MAERVGFEPTAHCCVTGFQDQLLKPLGHLSESLGCEAYIIIPANFCQVYSEKNSSFRRRLRLGLHRQCQLCQEDALGL